MQQKSTQVDFRGQHVYVGIDVAQRSWRVHILVGDLFHRHFSQRPDPRALAEYLKRNFPGAEYHCVYEAGCCGFWIQNSLQQLGIDCIVTNAADVPINAGISGSTSGFRDMTDAITWTSFLKPFGNSGRIG